MSSPKAPNRKLRLLITALLCALPFLGGGYYLQAQARLIDTMPLDEYSGLRWLPGGKSLGFLHRPLGGKTPADTEIWKASGDGNSFSQVGRLSAEYQWTLTNRSAGKWVLLEGRKGESEPELLLADAAGQVKPLKREEGWELLLSQGDGVFFYRLEDSLPFDQFVDVEAAPDVKPELEELPEPDPWAEPPEEASEEDVPKKPPTHLGIQIAEYDPEQESMVPLFSIPYNTPEEQPIVQLLRRSPDGRFLALVVKFGESASPGLWVYDKNDERLLWTRALVDEKPLGMDWSSDSVRVTVTDNAGVLILEKALGIESKRLEMSAASRGLKPHCGPGRAIYLANLETVYAVEAERGVAEPLFEATGVEDLNLQALSGRVAYSQAPKGYRELLIRDLKSGQALSQSTYPGSQKQKAQGTLTYQVGNAIRYAWKLWTGRG